MVSCELCGKDSKLLSVLIEGVKFNVCGSCSSHGKILQDANIKKGELKKPIIRNEVLDVVVDNYSDIIKNFREKKSMTQKELALKLNEKESMIAKIEQGTLKPSLDLAKKLERFLGVKLVTKEKISESLSLNVKRGSLTIGDFLKKDS